MAVNFASLIVEMGLLAVLVLILHRLTDRYGLGPLFMTIGGIMGILRFASSISVYISLSDDLNFTVASNVFIPIVIMSILVIYVANGTVAARIAIFSIVAVEILTLIAVNSLSRHLGLEGGGSFASLGTDSPIFDVRMRDVFASSTAFIIDLYAVGIIFQVCTNYFPRMARWLSIGLTLVMVLILNSMIFWSLSVDSAAELMDFLPASIIGNIISAIVLIPLVTYYLLRVAPSLSTHVGIIRRPTFDLLFGSFGHVEQELQESRTALAQTAAQYRELTANINQGLWLYDPSIDKVTHISPAYEQIWGMTLEVAQQDPKNFLKRIHPDDRKRIAALLPTQPDGNYDESFRVVREDGSIHWVRDRAFVIYNDEGGIYRLAGTSEDITERKRAEEHLRYVSEFRELITTLAIDFITISSESIDNRIQEVMHLIGEFVDADRVFIALFEDDLEAIRGAYEWCAPSISPIITQFQNVPSAKFALAIERIKQLKTVLIPRVVDLPEDSSLKSELIRGDVQSMIIIPLVSAGGLIGFLGLHKITGIKAWTEDTATLLKIVGELYVNALERKEAEQTLLDKQKLQIDLEKEKELGDFRVQFISMVSHQFRTPLSVIHTASSILENHSDQLAVEKRQSYFKRITDQVDYLSGMLDNVLLTMQAEAGQLEFRPEPLDYDEVFGEIVEELRLTIADNQTLIFEAGGDLKGLAGDKTLLGHVVSNLLSNAIKYSPDGGDIRLDVRREAAEVILEIKDQGMGMSAEDQQHLFEPYFRAKNARKIRGTGLGLKIAADCVALHGGRIDVESELGEGTTFRVFIPVGG